MSGNHDGAPLPDLSLGTVDDHAEEWLVYLYSGSATQEGWAQFRLWLAESPRHRATYARTEQLWRDLTSTDGKEAVTETVATLPMAAPRRARPTGEPQASVGRRVIQVAASAAAVVAIGFMSIFALDRIETRADYATAPGEIRTVTLADGTQVTLGGDTQLKTGFSKVARHVTFVQGGAYFKVSKNPDRPFSVHADKVAITVTGTAFDVRQNPEDVRVSVAEGRVRVGGRRDDWFGGNGNEVHIGAGEQVIATRDGTVGKVHRFDTETVLAWSEGRLVYIDEQLSTVVAEVNRYRKDKIRLADPAIGKKTVTMIVFTDDTDRFLSGLESAENVTVTRVPSEVVVSAKR